MSEEATSKQMAFLKVLMKERNFDGIGSVFDHLTEKIGKCVAERRNLDRNQVSLLIQYLQSLPKPGGFDTGHEEDSDIPW